MVLLPMFPAGPPTPSTSLSHTLSNTSTSSSSAAVSQSVIFGLSFLHLGRSNSNHNKSPRLGVHSSNSHSQQCPQLQSQYEYNHHRQTRRRRSRTRKARRRHSASSTDPNELSKLRPRLALDVENALDINHRNIGSGFVSTGSSTFFFDTASTVASPTSNTNPPITNSEDSTMPRSFQLQRPEVVAAAVQPPTANTNTTVPPPGSSSSAAPNLAGRRQFPPYVQYEVFIDSSSNKNTGLSKRSASTPPIFSRFGRQHRHNNSTHKSRAPSTATASSIDGRLSKESTAPPRVGSFKSHASSPSVTSGGRRTAGPGFRPGELSREEFEALPVAIRLKYFSTLERLRFAQESVDGPSPESPLFEDAVAQNLKRRRKAAHRASRFASDSFADRLVRRRSSHGPQTPTYDSAWFENLPDKIKKRHFSRDEQIALSRQRRESVILDPADEAVYKIGRRASRHITPPVDTPSLTTPRDSMDSTDSDRRDNEPKQDTIMATFLDSFRWLDQDEDLDLKLFLDDYHANLTETLPERKYPRRPSFRRHLSITKIPFGRPSVSSTRPGTKENCIQVSPNIDASPRPAPMVSTFEHEALPKPPQKLTRRARTLSLISNQNNNKNSAPSDPMIDPEAAHYQDPEARLKLRVYLASPQKFDEAVEFGFPSKDVISAHPSKEIQNHKRRESRAFGGDKKEKEDEKMRTFLADDQSSTCSEDISMADPDSPLTPQTFEKPLPRLPSESKSQNPTDTYAQVPATSREMTLRMTLTRPDLRACEEQIYGWQNMGGRKSTTTRPEALAAVTYLGTEQRGPKQSMEQVFSTMDHDHAAERGVMKRFWDRVRHH